MLHTHPHDINRTDAKRFISMPFPTAGFAPTGMWHGTGPHQSPAGAAEPGPSALRPRSEPRARLRAGGGPGRARRCGLVLEPRQIALEGCWWQRRSRAAASAERAPPAPGYSLRPGQGARERGSGGEDEPGSLLFRAGMGVFPSKKEEGRGVEERVKKRS